MNKIMKYIITFTIICLVTAGCHPTNKATENYRIEKYEAKTYKSMVDQKVEIKHRMEINQGDLELTFSEKQIPFEIPLTTEAPTYEGGLNISGSLGEGKVKVLVLSSSTGSVMWEQILTPQKMKARPRFDMYSGEYILRLEFDGAKVGHIKIKFVTTQT